jgi:hypothetical protein
MKATRTKWGDPDEDEVLLKLYHGERLTRKDHFTLANIYSVHGASSVYMAMANLSGSLPRISRRLAQAAANHRKAETS